MIQRKDFVLRMVKQLADVLGAALRLRREKKFDQALQANGDGYAGMLGVEREVLLGVDVASALSLLSGVERVVLWARLLEDEAETQAEAGNPYVAMARRTLALKVWGAAYGMSQAEEIREGLLRVGGLVSPELQGDAEKRLLAEVRAQG